MKEFLLNYSERKEFGDADLTDYDISVKRSRTLIRIPHLGVCHTTNDKNHDAPPLASQRPAVVLYANLASHSEGKSSEAAELL